MRSSGCARTWWAVVGEFGLRGAWSRVAPSGVSASQVSRLRNEYRKVSRYPVDLVMEVTELDHEGFGTKHVSPPDVCTSLEREYLNDE